MDEMATQPYALQTGEGWTYHFDKLGVDFVFKVGAHRHGRRLAIVEFTTRAGEEPADHTHATEDEFAYVIEGVVAFRCGDDRFEVAGGGCVFLPRGIEHGFQILSPGDAKVLVVTTPAPDDAVRGWGGFFGRVEQEFELRKSPPWDQRRETRRREPRS